MPIFTSRGKAPDAVERWLEQLFHHTNACGFFACCHGNVESATLVISLLPSVPDTASYIRGWIQWYWHQMIYFPETLNTISTTLQCHRHIHLFLLSYAHYLLCACWHLEAMKGSSSLTSCRLLILSRPLSSLIWAQLPLLVPALGIRSPLSQNGAPIHRSVHTPLPGSGTPRDSPTSIITGKSKASNP